MFTRSGNDYGDYLFLEAEIVLIGSFKILRCIFKACKKLLRNIVQLLHRFELKSLPDS